MRFCVCQNFNLSPEFLREKGAFWVVQYLSWRGRWYFGPDIRLRYFRALWSWKTWLGNGSWKVLSLKILSWKIFPKLKSFTEFMFFMRKIPISIDFSKLIENFPTMVTVLQLIFLNSAQTFSLWIELSYIFSN